MTTENQTHIPEGWKEYELGELLDYKQPYKYIVASTEYSKNSGIPVLTAGKSFILGYTDESENIYNDLPVVIFDDFTTDSKYVDFPFKVKSSAMKFLLPKNEIDLFFVFTHLQRLRFRDVSGDHKRMWISEFSKLKIVLPTSPTEQQKIASILSKLDEAITQTEQLIAKYKKIKEGLMHDLLTRGIDEQGNIRSEETHKFKDSPLGRIPEEWECVTIGDIIEKLRSGVTPRGGSEIYQKEGIMFLRSQNIYPYGFELEDVAYISYEINNKMLGSELKELDVLLNITGASIGRSTYVPAGFPTANVNQHVCSIRIYNPSEEKSIFLSSFLNSVYGQNQIAQHNAGSNRQGLNYSQIKQIYIPDFKSDYELSNFKTTINKIENTINQYKNNLTKLQLKKSGLMHDLLTGKVRVKI